MSLARARAGGARHPLQTPCLLSSPHLLPLSQHALLLHRFYAKDGAAFASDFASAFSRLLELGCKLDKAPVTIRFK